jgi:hypothetical protein
VREPIIAVLQPQTDNPFDLNAISVWVSTPDNPERTCKAGRRAGSPAMASSESR